ncbi:hypothetical protein KC333_g31 [Hortaea werneckii]|nr:hypothetical protein KC333_g31 [Hortaea werneckii]
MLPFNRLPSIPFPSLATFPPPHIPLILLPTTIFPPVHLLSSETRRLNRLGALRGHALEEASSGCRLWDRPMTSSRGSMSLAVEFRLRCLLRCSGLRDRRGDRDCLSLLLRWR